MIKILIILPYYNRPNFVKGALKSVLISGENYGNWELAFIDDGSSHKGEPVVRDLLADHLSKVRFYDSKMSPEDKKEKGCYLGFYVNKAIEDSDADVGITLCDDDELHPNYLFNLNNYFTDNPSILSCYSNVYVYNPILESKEGYLRPHKLNQWKTPIAAACRVDSSQVAWRLIVNKQHDCWFDYPRSKDHDAAFFAKMNEKCGLTYPTGFISQYKAEHSYQLGNAGVFAWDNPIDLSDDPMQNYQKEKSFIIHSSIKKLDELEHIKEYTEAINLSKQILKLNSEDSDLWFRLGGYQLAVGDREGAFDSLTNAAKYTSRTENLEFVKSILEKL